MIPLLRRWARCLLPVLPLVALEAHGEGLPPGRYRCYQPPGYAVSAWFDILPDGTYSFQGQAPQAFSFDGATRKVTWSAGELARISGGGVYHAPSSGAATGQRHAIVLDEKDPDTPSSECFLTTH